MKPRTGTPPNGFLSWDEYYGYVECLGKSRPGDIAVACFNVYGGNKAYPSSVKTSTTMEFPIIGISNGRGAENNYPLLGSRESDIGFWRIHDDYGNIENLRRDLKSSPLPFLDRQLTYAYWAYPSDIKIIKIKKQ